MVEDKHKIKENMIETRARPVGKDNVGAKNIFTILSHFPLFILFLYLFQRFLYARLMGKRKMIDGL